MLQFVQSNLVSGKVAIHGESMGGCVASYVASLANLHFAFINRTFGSLSDIAYWGFGGKIGSSLFALFTLNWKDNCVKYF